MTEHADVQALLQRIFESHLPIHHSSRLRELNFESCRLEPPDGDLASAEARVTLRLINWDMPDGQRTIRDVYEQEVYLGRLTELSADLSIPGLEQGLLALVDQMGKCLLQTEPGSHIFPADLLPIREEDKLTEKGRQDILEYIDVTLHSGFKGRGQLSDVIEQVSEAFSDQFDYRELEEFVGDQVRSRFDSLLREQEGWEVPTDCDRLDRAFAALEEAGVVARQDFACCQNCGHAEMPDEIKGAWTGSPVWGYVFYHQQDTESAVQGHGLYLAYGALDEAVEGQVKVGQKVVEALESAGLAPKWSGQTSQRIHVPLNWRRRLPRE